MSTVWLAIVVFFLVQSIPQQQDLNAEYALRFISDDALSLLAGRGDEIEGIRYGPEWVSIYYVEDHDFSIDENELLTSELLDARAPALSRLRKTYWVWSLMNYWIAPLVLLLALSTLLTKWLKRQN